MPETVNTWYVVVVPLVTAALAFAGTWLMHIRKRAEIRLNAESKEADRAQSAAQQAIQMALEERQLETQIVQLREDVRSERTAREALERRFSDLRERLPIEFTRREDFINGQVRQERRLDAIYEMLSGITQTLQSQKD